jgi:hypothetical protein
MISKVHSNSEISQPGGTDALMMGRFFSPQSLYVAYAGFKLMPFLP